MGVQESSDVRRSCLTRSLQVTAWIAAILLVIPLGIYVGTYFACVRKIVVIKREYAPPPFVDVRNVPVVQGPKFPAGYERLFGPLYEMDRKWLRAKWWAEAPQLTAQEQTALGISLKDEVVFTK